MIRDLLIGGIGQLDTEVGTVISQDANEGCVFERGLTMSFTEPAVMLATLNIHEWIGQKVDREAVATHVLPQL